MNHDRYAYDPLNGVLPGTFVINRHEHVSIVKLEIMGGYNTLFTDETEIGERNKMRMEPLITRLWSCDYSLQHTSLNSINPQHWTISLADIITIAEEGS